MSQTSVESADRFFSHPLWSGALWVATTYHCHPTGAAPPVMGLVFADYERGVELFSKWTDDWGNSDQDDSIRITVVEGEIPGQVDGYSIRLSADAVDAEVGQVNRMHPSPETEKMFGEFKAQFLQHGEFLLCPVIQSDDGQLWFNVNSGIIKRQIEFRNADDVGESDPDAVVLKPSEAETALQEIIEVANRLAAEGSGD